MNDKSTSRLAVGDRVEVRRRYDGAYSSGFSVVAVAAGRVLVRRCSDGAVLPASFAAGEVRQAGGRA